MLKKFKTAAKDWALSHKNKTGKTRHIRALTMCRKCYTYYYNNSWHFERPDYIENESDVEVPVRFTECQACLQEEEAFYDMESGVFA
jgi:hypothetical protein